VSHARLHVVTLEVRAHSRAEVVRRDGLADRRRHVRTRVHALITYDVKLDAACAACCKAIMTMPAMREWMEAASHEPDELEELNVEF
jgi:hypothetical protein